VTVLVGLLVGEIDDIVEVEGELTMPLPGEGPRTVDFLRNTQSDGDIVHIIEPEVFFKRRDIEAFRKAAAKPIQPVPSKE
jgi:chemotaxis signal transduction protein